MKSRSWPTNPVRGSSSGTPYIGPSSAITLPEDQSPLLAGLFPVLAPHLGQGVGPLHLVARGVHRHQAPDPVGPGPLRLGGQGAAGGEAGGGEIALGPQPLHLLRDAARGFLQRGDVGLGPGQRFGQPVPLTLPALPSISRVRRLCRPLKAFSFRC